jgi:hypothetical protein
MQMQMEGGSLFRGPPCIYIHVLLSNIKQHISLPSDFEASNNKEKETAATLFDVHSESCRADVQASSHRLCTCNLL